MLRHDLGESVLSFAGEIQALRGAHVNVDRFLADAVKNHGEHLNAHLYRHGVIIEGQEPVAYRLEHPAARAKAAEIKRLLKEIEEAHALAPAAFFIGLLARFEALALRLLETMGDAMPHVFLDAERQFSWNDLESVTGFAELRRAEVEKGIEGVAHYSPYELLKFLRKHLKLDLNLDSVWPRFAEASERRNCHAHNGGRVSRRYLETTKKVSYLHDQELAIGDPLPLSREYFDVASHAVLETGVFISLLVWRVLGADKERVVEVLNDVALNMLSLKQANAALRLLTFAERELLVGVSEAARLINRINLAQAHKWSENEDGCRTELDKQDWTAAGDKFLFAVAVLRDDFVAAEVLMPRCCRREEGSISDDALLTWLIFARFRDSEAFRCGFEAAFGHPPHLDAVEVAGVQESVEQGELPAPSEHAPL